ncbi:hypothetical protein ACU4GA_05590 [Methylobacterium oryzae CBMB20]
MLGEHPLELGVAARILGLELDPRRPDGVALRESRHAVAEQHRGGGVRLGAEQGLPLGLRAVAAAAEAERQRAVGMPQAEMQGREGAHRDAGDVAFGAPRWSRMARMSSAARACA